MKVLKCSTKIFRKQLRQVPEAPPHLLQNNPKNQDPSYLMQDGFRFMERNNHLLGDTNTNLDCSSLHHYLELRLFSQKKLSMQHFMTSP